MGRKYDTLRARLAHRLGEGEAATISPQQALDVLCQSGAESPCGGGMSSSREGEPPYQELETI